MNPLAGTTHRRVCAPPGWAKGVLISTPVEGGPTEERDLVQCVHCQYSWVWEPGSGKLRGYCTRCNGPVCGHRACRERGCVHHEQLLHAIEEQRTVASLPITARAGG